MSDEATPPLAAIQVNEPDDDPSITTEKRSTSDDDNKDPLFDFDQASSWINSHPALKLMNNNNKKNTTPEDEESPYSKREGPDHQKWLMTVSINGKSYGVRSDPMKGLEELSTVISGAVDKTKDASITAMDAVSDLIIKATDEYIIDTPEDKARKEQSESESEQSWLDTTQLKKQVSEYFGKVEAEIFPPVNTEVEEDARNECVGVDTTLKEDGEGRDVTV